MKPSVADGWNTSIIIIIKFNHTSALLDCDFYTEDKPA
jgi:hypothetical protein